MAFILVIFQNTTDWQTINVKRNYDTVNYIKGDFCWEALAGVRGTEQFRGLIAIQRNSPQH